MSQLVPATYTFHSLFSTSLPWDQPPASEPPEPPFSPPCTATLGAIFTDFEPLPTAPLFHPCFPPREHDKS